MSPDGATPRHDLPGRPAGTGETTLEELLAVRPRLDVEEGLAILTSILEALDGLHGAGRVHGAVEPANVVVVAREGGGPEVRLRFPDPEERMAIEAGLHSGTPRYLAPECLQGEPPSAAADVHAAGVLGYELFAGASPYPPPPGDEAFRARTWTPVPVAEIVPEVPLRLDRLIERALRTDPAARPTARNALATVRNLHSCLGARPPPAPVAAVPEPAPPPAPGLLGRIARLFRSAPPPSRSPAPRPAATAEAPDLRRRSALELLSLDDLGPLPRDPAPPVPEAILREAIEATLELVRVECRLPPFPTVALKVVELVETPGVGAGELVRLINQDPSLTAQVLRLANSAWSSRGLEIQSARDAVTRLGFREVAQVASAAATKALFEAELASAAPPVREAQRLLWSHSLTTALSAAWLAAECRADAQKAFLAGMLHDVGKMLALRAFGLLLATDSLPSADPRRVIGPLLEATHVDLGARMAQDWELPAHVVRACAEHHRPAALLDGDRELHLVRVVSGIAAAQLDPGWTVDRLEESQDSAAALGLDRFRVRATAAQVRSLATKAAALA